MKAKLITVAMGALLLGTGTLAMAHDWRDRDDRDRDDGWRRHEWREHQWRKHEWREHHSPRWYPEYYRYEPRYEPRYVPVPVPEWRYRSSYPQPYGYDSDGVSIILRGRIN
jgi:hypothetical protein